MLHLSRSPRCLLASTRDAALQSGALVWLFAKSSVAMAQLGLWSSAQLKHSIKRLWDEQDAVLSCSLRD